MAEELEFLMSDGLLIRGTIEGNRTSNHLVVMLHSGGYDRHERGVKEVSKDEISGMKKIEYYNAYGNYDYLSNLLKQDACILRIDQRNHGQSGKNIDVSKMKIALEKLKTEDQVSNQIIRNLMHNNKNKLRELEQNFQNEKVNDLIHHPILKDMSFQKMKEDLEEVMEQFMKANPSFSSIDFVGTCMGTVVASLYLFDHPTMANSLTLFSPLYTFDYSILNSPENAGLMRTKWEAVKKGNQFRLGNAIEGPNTHREVASFAATFFDHLKELNIPIFCIQGTDDALVPVSIQREIFRNLKEYREKHHLKPVNYAEIPAVHCLYDSIFPALLETSEFIYSQQETLEKKK